MSDFKKLFIWEKSFDFTIRIYSLTEKFPDNEKLNLTNQLRRSAISIPSNIAEGHSRSSKKDFAHFLEIDLGSAYENETQLLISERLGYINEEERKLAETELKIIQTGIFRLRNRLKINNRALAITITVLVVIGITIL